MTSCTPEGDSTGIMLAGLYQLGVSGGKQRHIRHRQRAYRLAVIAVFQADKAALLRHAVILPVMEAHFQCDFRRAGAIRAVKSPIQTAQFAQFLGKLDYRLMGETRQDDVFQLIQLLLDGVLDAGMTVAEQIHPPGAHRIQIALAVEVLQPDAVATTNWHQRKCLVALHLRAGVPDMLVRAAQPVGIVHEAVPVISVKIGDAIMLVDRKRLTKNVTFCQLATDSPASKGGICQ